ncbi:uncharacterized protein [Palaemon carinicauda]|uniref:uncharacterized protein n=1 Tax=Palaemon carinicauda TaxID=392227 RepID=UPI0035B67399
MRPLSNQVRTKEGQAIAVDYILGRPIDGPIRPLPFFSSQGFSENASTKGTNEFEQELNSSLVITSQGHYHKGHQYHEKLDAILADLTKLERLTSNPGEDIKREANRTIEAINAATNGVHMPMISGYFGPGYLYGNVRTHKQGNPLRPIISQCPKPTYQLAKRLNAILTPYVPDRYCLASSAEFLEKIKDVRGEGVIASMEVESLFTNVPVDKTIDLIAD